MGVFACPCVRACYLCIFAQHAHSPIPSSTFLCPPRTQCSRQTSEAAEKCLHEKRKTINGEDILTSMRALGFDNYEGVLKVYLAKYREVSWSERRGAFRDVARRTRGGSEEGEGGKGKEDRWHEEEGDSSSTNVERKSR